MTRLKLNLLAATLGVALLSPVGRAAKPGSTSSPPSKLLVVADFQGHLATVGGQPYADNNLEGGWSNMPGTGNYTLQLIAGSGSRVIALDFSDPIDAASDPSVASGQTSLFLSINRICAVDDYDSDTQTCLDNTTSEGSLKAMTFGGPDLLMNLRSTFDDPLVNKASLKVHCGPGNPLDIELNPPDPIVARCTRGRAGGDACMEWSLSPATENGSLGCTVLRQTSSRGSVTYTDLGLYDMSFTLTLERDEDGNGVGDCTDDPLACN